MLLLPTTPAPANAALAAFECRYRPYPFNDTRQPFGPWAEDGPNHQAGRTLAIKAARTPNTYVVPPPAETVETAPRRGKSR